MSTLRRIRCLLGAHKRAHGARWNEPYWFAHCRDCETPMIRSPGGRWSAVPDGYRVVWRAPAPDPTAIATADMIERITVAMPRSDDLSAHPH